MVGTLIVDLIPRAGVSGTPPGGDTRRSEDGSCGRPRCTVHFTIHPDGRTIYTAGARTPNDCGRHRAARSGATDKFALEMREFN